MGLDDYDTDRPEEEDYDDTPDKVTSRSHPTVVMYLTRDNVEQEVPFKNRKDEAEKAAIEEAERLKNEVEEAFKQAPDGYTLTATVAEGTTKDSVSWEH